LGILWENFNKTRGTESSGLCFNALSTIFSF
jgi:hypothetical protein